MTTLPHYIITSFLEEQFWRWPSLSESGMVWRSNWSYCCQWWEVADPVHLPVCYTCKINEVLQRLAAQCLITNLINKIHVGTVYSITLYMFIKTNKRSKYSYQIRYIYIYLDTYLKMQVFVLTHTYSCALRMPSGRLLIVTVVLSLPP